ncbi:hypothetical protein RFI_14245 [Reticulomyxa filosa]|uniref:USP domain-containing protein n=1 Tax=Reticulomyxa filosa TaxID=46433 RepID=X6NAN4_RETFI|nr:hypothetical protein RFI_14245 [Reticulomyxa filosa]|eukprot:ETO22948.1 hypothetical protein RFI_14245 [Reticulomyxa filosa]
MPLTVVINVGDELKEVCSKMSSDQLKNIISNMLLWPMVDYVTPWVLKVLEALMRSARFDVLFHVACCCCVDVAKQLLDVTLVASAFSVLKWILLGYRQSPQAFHSVLNYLRESLVMLSDPSNDYYSMLKWEMVETIHVCMFLFTGYPELYTDLLMTMNDLKCNRYPDENRLRTLLKQHRWQADQIRTDTTNKDFGVDASDVALYGFGYSRSNFGNENWSYRSDTDGIRRSGSGRDSGGDWVPYFQSEVTGSRDKLTNKAGLTNLGSTCYMNSVLQALYVTDGFRTQIVDCSMIFSREVLEEKSSNGTLWLQESQWQVKKKIVDEMQSIFQNLDSTDKKAAPTKSLTAALASQWRPGRQVMYLYIYICQDASEFAKYLLDEMWEVVSHTEYGREELVKHWSASDDHISKLLIEHRVDIYFGGLMRNSIQCLECNNVSSKYEAFHDLAVSKNSLQKKKKKNYNANDKKLAFPPNKSTSQYTPAQMIDFHFESEMLEGANAYSCERCGTKVKANRFMSMIHSPKFLVVCLKRFTWDIKLGKRGKILDPVSCPPTLSIFTTSQSLSPSFSSLSVQKDSTEKEHSNDIVEHKYVLYAAVVHSGQSAEFGHYYTIARHSSCAIDMYLKQTPEAGDWFMFNDSIVSKSSYRNLCSLGNLWKTDVPYMLFYCRVDKQDISERSTTDISNDKDNTESHHKDVEKNNDEGSSSNPSERSSNNSSNVVVGASSG